MIGPGPSQLPVIQSRTSLAPLGGGTLKKNYGTFSTDKQTLKTNELTQTLKTDALTTDLLLFALY